MVGKGLMLGEVRLEDLIERLAFTEEEAENAVLDQAKLFMAAAGFRVRKMRVRQRAEMELEQMRMALSLTWRKKKSANSGSKKQFTERYLTDLVESSPRVRTAKEAVLKAEQLEEYAKLLIEAYRQRRDALKILTNFIWAEEGIRMSAGLGQEDRMKRTRQRMRERFPQSDEE